MPTLNGVYPPTLNFWVIGEDSVNLMGLLDAESLCLQHLPPQNDRNPQIFKPPPPVGAGGGYLFSGRPSVPLSVRPSVIHVVVLCFRDISSICWRIFAKLLSLVHLGTAMNWLDFGVKSSKVKVTAWPNTSQIFMFPRYLQCLLTDFRQTFVTVASWDTDDLITFLGQKVKGGGAQHSTLPSSATFSSYTVVFRKMRRIYWWKRKCDIRNFGWVISIQSLCIMHKTKCAFLAVL